MATLTKIRIGDTFYDIGSVGEATDTNFEIIDITGLSTVSDINKLKHCYLKDGTYVYHLSYNDGNEYYFENTDETVYRYISVYGDGSINRESSTELATKDNVIEIVNSKITVVINADDTIDLTIK